MQKPSLTNLDAFASHVGALYERLSQLYTKPNAGLEYRTELLPVALKELGVAAEELQVATEELHQQNEQMTIDLQSAADETLYYQSLFDHAAHALLLTDLSGKIQVANWAAAQLLKQPQAILIGQLLVRYVPLEQRSMFRLQLNRLKQASRSLIWTSHLQPTKGQPVELILSASLVRSNALSGASVHWLLQEALPIQTALAAPELNQSNSPPVIQPNQPSLLEHSPSFHYDKGEIISFEPQTLWYVTQGLVKLSTLSESNEEILLGLVGVGMPFTVGSATLLTYQAIALTHVQLLRLPSAEAQSQPGITQMLMLKLQQRLQHAEGLLNILGQRRAHDRLYHLLSLLKREIGELPESGAVRLGVRLTHEDLANACCTTRVTMTRLLGRLQRDGKITFDPASHIILTKSF